MRISILDLGLLLIVCGLVTPAATTLAPAPATKVDLRQRAATPPDYWTLEHHRPNCGGRQVARIEEFRAGDWIQQALVDRGLVVYVAGYLGCQPTPPHTDVDQRRAIWLCGSGFVDNPIPGKSWYCKGCDARWGGMESFLDHPLAILEWAKLKATPPLPA